jgi:hypothetical protein
MVMDAINYNDPRDIKLMNESRNEQYVGNYK